MACARGVAARAEVRNGGRGAAPRGGPDLRAWEQRRRAGLLELWRCIRTWRKVLAHCASLLQVRLHFL